MKFLTIAVIASTLLSGIAKANVIHASTGTTMIPTATLALLGECVKSEGALACLWPISTSAVTSILLLKEEVQQVEQDSYNFLACEAASDALKVLIENLRSEHADLQQHSDQDIVGLLIVSLNTK